MTVEAAASTAAGVVRDAAPFVVLGALLGAAYFAALWLNVGLYLRDGPAGLALALHLGRVLTAGAAFTLIAPHGARALLAAAGGFLLARLVAVRPPGKTPG